jgi:hypothetical protein
VPLKITGGSLEESMTDPFVELSDLSHKLNQASDRLNSTISGINLNLRRLNLGLEVWLTNRPIRCSDQEEIWIGYCEIEGEWQLGVKRRTCDQSWDGPIDDAPEDAIEEDYRALLKVSRGLRLDAVSLIPKLLYEIKRRGESLLEEIAAAERSAEKL